MMPAHERAIVLDTETTGTDPERDRIVEIGCVETIGGVKTGRTFHVYLNPERAIDAGAYDVHGISLGFLKEWPTFAQVATSLIEFLGDSTLVIHNFKFDIGFIREELKRVGVFDILWDQEPGKCIDTLDMARRKFPGSPASLDALCRRYQIDNRHRTEHGALLDADLLADVWHKMTGRDRLDLGENASPRQQIAVNLPDRSGRTPRPIVPDPEVQGRHLDFLSKIEDHLWSPQYAP